MSINQSYADLSEIEQEIDMLSQGNEIDRDAEDMTYEFEFEEDERNPEFEFEEDERNSEFEFEDETESESDYSNPFAERFYELSLSEFEDSVLDGKINEILDEMEREYFWGGLKKLVKKGFNIVKKVGSNVLKASPIGQGLKAFTQLAKGNLKGLLGQLAKTALTSFVPGGAAIGPLLSALGFKETEFPEENREAWNNYTDIVKNSYEYLAANLDHNSNNPVNASNLAHRAFTNGLRSVQGRNYLQSKSRRGKIRKVRLGRGQKLLIIVE